MYVIASSCSATFFLPLERAVPPLLSSLPRRALLLAPSEHDRSIQKQQSMLPSVGLTLAARGYYLQPPGATASPLRRERMIRAPFSVTINTQAIVTQGTKVADGMSPQPVLWRSKVVLVLPPPRSSCEVAVYPKAQLLLCARMSARRMEAVCERKASFKTSTCPCLRLG